jgi:hypothetical protein
MSCRLRIEQRAQARFGAMLRDIDDGRGATQHVRDLDPGQFGETQLDDLTLMLRKVREELLDATPVHRRRGPDPPATEHRL